MPSLPSPPPPPSVAVRVEHPTVADGAAMWRLASRTTELDLNPSYAYLLWCRDFSRTSVVARVPGDDDALLGYVSGFRRPDAADVLMVWQVAVDRDHRGCGIAGAMLDALAPLAPFVETTVAPGNAPSLAMFHAFARRHGASIESSMLFRADDFPDPHEPELLLRIGPLRQS